MSLGVVREVGAFQRVFDCLARVPSGVASAFAGAGYRGVARYIDGPFPLLAPERDAIWSAGLGILPLTVAPTGVQLSHSVGEHLAAADLEAFDALGVPEGCHCALDLESAAGDASDVAAYVEARAAAWAESKRVPMLYVGANQPLAGGALYAIPSVHLYWRAGSVGIPEPTCGFAMWQIPPLDQTFFGQRVDVNVTGRDTRGRTPLLWYPS